MVILRHRTPHHPFFPLSHFKQEITSQKPLGEKKQFNEIVRRTSHESYNSFLQKKISVLIPLLIILFMCKELFQNLVT